MHYCPEETYRNGILTDAQAMWHHPITAKQMRVLTDDWGYKSSGSEETNGWIEVIPPISKALACGDKGDGQYYFLRQWPIAEVPQRGFFFRWSRHLLTAL